MSPESTGCVENIPEPTFPEPPTKRQAWRATEIREAWRRAVTHSRPLLLIVVPTDSSESYRQSRAWGEAITHGPESFIASLTRAELATATQEEVARFLPDYQPQTPEPTMVRVDVCALPTTWQGVRVDALHQSSNLDEDDAINARIAAIAQAVEALLPAGTASSDAEGLRDRPIPGSRWGESTGCGADYETEDPLIDETGWGYDCGMGHVSLRSARFLDFLTSAVE